MLQTFIVGLLSTIVGGVSVIYIMRFIDMEDKSPIITPLKNFLKPILSFIGEWIWFATIGFSLTQAIGGLTILSTDATNNFLAIWTGAWLGIFLSVLRNSIISQAQIASEKMRDELRAEILEKLSIKDDSDDKSQDIIHRLESDSEKASLKE